MKGYFESHPFWGRQSPLSALTGIGLVIMASSRFAFALVCAGALLWVFGLTALIFSCARPIMPSRGKMIILLFVSTFLCGSLMLIISLLNPLLIMGTAFFLLLIPPCCLGTGFFEAAESVDPLEAVYRALLDALCLGGIILAVALIREPLGMGTLSVPGGIHGIIELFDNSESNVILPARIFSVSGGGLLILGYGVALYRYFRELNGNTPRDLSEED